MNTPSLTNPTIVGPIRTETDLALAVAEARNAGKAALARALKVAARKSRYTGGRFAAVASAETIEVALIPPKPPGRKR